MGRLLVVVLLAGCEGSILTAAGREASVPEAPVAAPAPALFQAPGLLALTRAEHEASVRMALGLGPTVSIDRAGAWETSEGAARGEVSSSAVNEAFTSAQKAVAAAFADASVRRGLTTCEVGSERTSPCVREALRRFGRRAWRRPLTTVELDRWSRWVERSPQAVPDAVATAFIGMLQSPHFLYRVELANEATGRAYSAFELVSRLAYLLWASPPDDALLDQAERLDITDDDAVARLAREMLAHPRAEAGRERVLDELLGAHALLTTSKNAALYPGFAAQRPSLKTSLVRSAAEAVKREGLQGLLTSRRAIVDREVAPLYGAPAPTGWASIDTGDRPGLLGHPAFAAQHAYNSTTSPALRGLFVRKRLLCTGIAPPPPGVSTTLPTLGQLVTKRELVAVHLSDPSCAGCHRFIDPVGLGLEPFDAVGQARTRENDLPIDASGVLDGVPFTGPPSLAHAVATHPLFERCVWSQWMTIGLGQPVDFVHPVVEQTLAPQGDLDASMLRFVTSATFRRAAAPEAP
jgi:hypothetical protein